MPSKYVVMVDGSELSVQAAKLCATVVKPEDEVILYNNFLRMYDRWSPLGVPIKGIVESHKKFILEAAEHFKGKDVKLFRKIEATTDNRYSMVDFLDQQKPDYVYMGNRGLGDIRGALGSSSQYVLHHYEQGAICLVRGYTPSDSTHYLLCCDGSDHAQRAATTLAKLLKPTDKVTLFACGLAPPKFVESGTTNFALDPIEDAAWGGWGLEENPDLEKQTAEVDAHARTATTDAMGIIKEGNKDFTNFNTQTVVATELQAALCKFASEPDNKVDVVVMGTRGRGLMKRLVLGSFSNHVFHHVENKAFLIVH